LQQQTGAALLHGEGDAYQQVTQIVTALQAEQIKLLTGTMQHLTETIMQMGGSPGR